MQKAELKNAYGFAKKGDYKKALAICDAFVAAYPLELSGYRERASVLLHKSDLSSAIADLGKLHELGSKEPLDYFDLGRAFLSDRQFEKSIWALTRSLELSSQHQNDYYVDSSLLLRALAYTESKQDSLAQADLAPLPADSAFYVRGYGLVAKASLQIGSINRGK